MTTQDLRTLKRLVRIALSECSHDFVQIKINAPLWEPKAVKRQLKALNKQITELQSAKKALGLIVQIIHYTETKKSGN